MTRRGPLMPHEIVALVNGEPYYTDRVLPEVEESRIAFAASER